MFEFDPGKSAANKAKHGIDFEEAQALWDDDFLFVLPSVHGDEPRFVAVGEIVGKLWSAIITVRGDKVRLISVRRSRKDEADVYQENKLRGA